MESRGAQDIMNHLRKLANQRNLLLYATPKGYPSETEITSKFFSDYQNRVMSLIRTYLLIEPYKEPQPFVQDSLDAFLGMLRKLKLDDLHNEF